MEENLEDILRNGFLTWRKNLKICIPFLLSSIIRLLLLISFLVIVVMLLNPIPSTIFESTYYPRHNSLSQIINSIDYPLLVLDILLFIFLLLVLYLISSFFFAGAIGMAQKAIETGKTSLEDMMEFGKRKFFSLFLAQLVISIGITFLLLLLVGIPILITLKVQLIGRSLMGFGGNLFSVLAIIVGIIFAALPFAIVISDLGAVNGLKRGYGFFMDNKLPVILLWVFIRYVTEFINYGILFIAVIVFSLGILFIPIPSNISNILPPTLQHILMSLSIIFLITIAIVILVSWIASIFVLSPLTTVWWSRLYINKTKSYEEEK